jgi:hypothetical protein
LQEEEKGEEEEEEGWKNWWQASDSWEVFVTFYAARAAERKKALGNGMRSGRRKGLC